MHNTNKKILQQANKAISKGHYEEFLSFCTEDTIWTFIGDQVLHGKNAVRNYIASEYLEPPIFEVEHLIAEGELVTAVGKISLKNKEGNIVDYQYCDVWRFSDNKMAELNAFVIKEA